MQTNPNFLPFFQSNGKSTKKEASSNNDEVFYQEEQRQQNPLLLTKSSTLEDDEQFEALLQQLGIVILYLTLPSWQSCYGHYAPEIFKM